MTVLTVELEVLSPLYLGGADQRAELRAPSINGLLRFWYRALDPEYDKADGESKISREERFFGGVSPGAGQSPFLLRLAGGSRTMTWDKKAAQRFTEGHDRKARNGLIYLGFPFHMGRGGDRNAIAPGERVTARCVVVRDAGYPRFRQALVASWWLLGHLGAAGSRARRGFGSLAIRSWKVDDGDPWPEPEELPLLIESRTESEWNQKMQQALAVMERWFGLWPPPSTTERPPPHPHIGDAFRAVLLHWPTHPWITHPLAGGYPIRVRLSEDDELKPRDLADVLLKEAEAVIDGHDKSAADALTALNADWLREGFIAIWRSFRDDLVARRGGPQQGDLLWEEMPADSRCPDHSIWDHLRVTSALAFLTKKVDRDHPQQPWLLRFSIGPVQAFLQESRTSRDLWIGSLLLSDLVWHAMLPFVERYGPDSILYPDLRGNPRADCWLADTLPEALPEALQSPSTFAAVLPNAFTVLVPKGGAGHLVPYDDLARESTRRVRARWSDLAEEVKGWLRQPEVVGMGSWEEIWDRQHLNGGPLATAWTAVPWRSLEKLKGIPRGHALPTQRPDHVPSGPKYVQEPGAKDHQAAKARAARLEPWVPRQAWTRYEWAREVFALTNLGLHQMERGFDYAVTLHQLHVRHAMRGATAPEAESLDERGEKCTLCGKRQALVGRDGNSPDDGGHSLDGARRAARGFWQHEQLDPSFRLDPGEAGQERLCGICAFKRYAIPAGVSKDGKVLTGLNRLWAGPNTPLEAVADTDGKVRVPFPSTVMLAAQDFLEGIVKDETLQTPLADIVRESRGLLSRTSHARSLLRLRRAAGNSETARKFLELETQAAIFPEALQTVLRRRGSSVPGKDRKAELERLEKLVRALRVLARSANHVAPMTRVAVLMLDGDATGRLLVGDTIQTTWREVIHPGLIDKISRHRELNEAGWGTCWMRRASWGHRCTPISAGPWADSATASCRGWWSGSSRAVSYTLAAMTCSAWPRRTRR